MTRFPDEPCLSCGKMMWWKADTSAPRGYGLCNTCRRAGWSVTDGKLDHRGVLCACGWWFMPVTKTEALGKTKACSRECGQRHRELTLRIRACLECGEAYEARTPNAVYCLTCAASRRRDHYRRKNHARHGGGYDKTIRALLIDALWERDRGRCHLCGLSVDRFLSGRHPGMASYDHKVPTSLGGSDEPDNLALAHLQCNVRRGNRLL